MKLTYRQIKILKSLSEIGGVPSILVICERFDYSHKQTFPLVGLALQELILLGLVEKKENYEITTEGIKILSRIKSKPLKAIS